MDPIAPGDLVETVDAPKTEWINGGAPGQVGVVLEVNLPSPWTSDGRYASVYIAGQRWRYLMGTLRKISGPPNDEEEREEEKTRERGRC